ncbi:hypothetical protein HOLleu_34151 [Holothuria leucospilota]|uniref:Uncharacterized protein n=1 Tax=Holothuria leucospilota TaxID=206669 RepID=A0A9Q0YPW0_HOLLE|nr:hypothetical protein HOLleu_34151 [Holothuria leucospilota]
MLCEGIHLYRKIITVFESGAGHLRMYFFIGWGKKNIYSFIRSSVRLLFFKFFR